MGGTGGTWPSPLTVVAIDRNTPLRRSHGEQGRRPSVALPEGNYHVTVTLGDRDGESTTTVKAESRRLMLEKVRTAPGKFATR